MTGVSRFHCMPHYDIDSNPRPIGSPRSGFHFIFGISLTVFGLFSGCQKVAPPPVAPKPPEVTVSFPVTEEVQEFEETTGRLVARESVEVRSRVSGYLDKALFKDGDNVQEGQLLFHIDARPRVSHKPERDSNGSSARKNGLANCSSPKIPHKKNSI